MTEKDVQPALDSKKHLHLIYMSTPTMYVYQQINPSGNITERRYYLAAKGAPKLIKAATGDVVIEGGMVYDPSQQPKGDPFRKMSERPVGVPN